MNIIPAIDIIEGKCVRLTRGDYARKKVYANDPVDVARMLEDHGFKYLHVVDLDGARSRHIVNIDVLERITGSTDLIVDFGGGVKSDDDIESAFQAGAHRVTGGSIAARNPQQFSGWIRKYGADRIVLGADIRDRQIAIEGWTESSGQDIHALISYYQHESIEYVICTDIERDGMLEGPAIDLYRELHSTFPGLKLIASGGVASIKDVDKLAETGVWGVIIGKAIYEGRIKPDELKKFLG